MKKTISALLVVFFVAVLAFAQDSVPAKPSSDSGKCENSYTVETGIYSSYLEIETAEDYHKHPVVQTEFTYERCGNKKTSYGVSLWGSLSTKSNPSGGTEFDVIGFVNTKLTDKVSLYVDGGVFLYPDDFKIYKANVTLSRKFEFSKSVEGTLSNSFSAYKPNDGSGTGGVINRVSLDIAKSFSKGTLTVTPSFSVDNNPFSLGNGKAAAMARLYVRYDHPLSERTTLFFIGGVSGPVLGDTDRRFRKVAGIGLTFHF